MTDMQLPDHVLRNREYWDAYAREWVQAGERNWAQVEPDWGVWSIPESELRMMENVEGLDVIEARLRHGLRFRVAGSPRREAGGHRQLRRTASHGPPAPVPARPGVSADPRQCRIGAISGRHVRHGDLRVRRLDLGRPLPLDPEAARLLRPDGRLVFLVNCYLSMLCEPDVEDAPATDRLLRPQFGSHRFEWSSDQSVEFHLPHGEMIRLLHANGLEVEDLIEIQAPEGATTRFAYMKPEWAHRWPSEEVWKARKRS